MEVASFPCTVSFPPGPFFTQVLTLLISSPAFSITAELASSQRLVFSHCAQYLISSAQSALVIQKAHF